MNWTIAVFVSGAVLIIAPLHAKPKKDKAQPIGVPEAVSATTPRTHEFHSDDISLVLRTLARSANLNMVVSEQVKGTVTARIEGKTPREAIETIAAAKELILEDKDGVLYVSPEHPAPPGTPEAHGGEKSLEEAFGELFTPALTKVYDSLLDYQARPETAQKIAKAKKALYDALIAEGFTPDQAFRIILSNEELSLPNSNN